LYTTPWDTIVKSDQLLEQRALIVQRPGIAGINQRPRSGTVGRPLRRDDVLGMLESALLNARNHRHGSVLSARDDRGGATLRAEWRRRIGSVLAA
jgi:hypothetical protein